MEVRQRQLIESELTRVKLNAQQARLAAEANVAGQHPLISAAKAQLAQAKYNLDQTKVRAPADGYVIGLTLRPGQRVNNSPVMSFVSDEATTIGVGVNQYALRFIEPGQPAEVTFKIFPGKTFSATVDRIATLNPQGQLSPGGKVPDAPGMNQSTIPYGVILKLADDAEIDVNYLPGGAAGTAAIYTDRGKMGHVIRKVMLRMQAWQNYFIP